jgi:hypothetical protein
LVGVRRVALTGPRTAQYRHDTANHHGGISPGDKPLETARFRAGDEAPIVQVGASWRIDVDPDEKVGRWTKR